jgi:CubicO group peptidase (beta-lactamase class C family)
MPRRLAVSMVVALLTWPSGEFGPATAFAEAPAPDRQITLPSGARIKVAAGWQVTEVKDGLTLEGPEGQLKVELVEVDASEGLPAAIAAAWSSRRPGFDRPVLASSDSPGRKGWDSFFWTEYKTSPEESWRVSASAARKGSLAIVILVEGPRSAAQRRSSQIGLVEESLRPAGYEREMYTGRTPRPLNDDRIAELRAFIERIRKAADVPGVSVILFDEERTFIEEGFGVRERGKPEPVTADSLYIIASNTKPLTTLLLARLVDEGRFNWSTPVIEVHPSFRIGDPEVTRRILMEHLICACTGLPRQDFEWLFTFHRSSPQGQLDVLATMQPTTDFGELFQYSNPLAAAAGYIGARTIEPDLELGKAYDQVMRDEVFYPLGMSRTTFSFDEALATDHASPHSWDLSLKNTPIDMRLNHSVIPVRPAGGAWSSVKDYAHYVRMELAKGRLPDGSTFVSEKNLLARRTPYVRVGEESWYGMGLWLEDVKGIRVIGHGGSMFGFKSDFFLVPDLGLGGVVLTNANSGWGVAGAVLRRTLEIVYDGKPEAEEDFVSNIRQNKAYLTGQQKDWTLPPDPTEVKRLQGRYQNAALGDVVVHPGEDEVVFQFGGWKSRMATKVNPDGTTSFVSVEPGVRVRLVLRDPQHEYEYEAVASP